MSLSCYACTDMIEELISRGQQLDAVHFTYEVGLVDKFPPVPLLKAYLRDAKKTVAEDSSNTGRASVIYSFISHLKHLLFASLNLIFLSC